MGQQGENQANEVQQFKCPNCGGEGYFETRKAGWVLAGKIRQTATVGCQMTLTQVLDKAVPALTVPTVRAIEDYCDQCGTRFVREVTLSSMVVAQHIVQPKGQRGLS